MRETWVEILVCNGLRPRARRRRRRPRTRQMHWSRRGLVDQRLPDGPGVELGLAPQVADADLTVLLVTGYANLENAIAAVWESMDTDQARAAGRARTRGALGLENGARAREPRPGRRAPAHEPDARGERRGSTSELSGLVRSLRPRRLRRRGRRRGRVPPHGSDVTGADSAALTCREDDASLRSPARHDGHRPTDVLRVSAPERRRGRAGSGSGHPAARGRRALVGVLVLGDAARRQTMFLTRSPRRRPSPSRTRRGSAGSARRSSGFQSCPG